MEAARGCDVPGNLISSFQGIFEDSSFEMFVRHLAGLTRGAIPRAEVSF